MNANRDAIARIGLQMETLLQKVPGAVDVVSDRIVGKPYIEYEIDLAGRFPASRLMLVPRTWRPIPAKKSPMAWTACANA